MGWRPAPVWASYRLTENCVCFAFAIADAVAVAVADADPSVLQQQQQQHQSSVPPRPPGRPVLSLPARACLPACRLRSSSSSMQHCCCRGQFLRQNKGRTIAPWNDHFRPPFKESSPACGLRPVTASSSFSLILASLPPLSLGHAR